MAALLDLYGVSDERQREGLLKLSEEVWRKGWWDGYASHVGGTLMDYTWLEDRARAIHSFEGLVLPGLLQTRRYAEAVITEADPTASATQIARSVEFRMARQRVLAKDEPPHLSFVVDEGVVRRTIGAPEVMREQLLHLIEMAKRTDIELRVLPFDAGAHAAHAGPFVVLRMPEPYPDVAYVETPAGGIYVETPETDRFLHAYDRLRDKALGTNETAELIAAAAEDLQ